MQHTINKTLKKLVSGVFGDLDGHTDDGNPLQSA